MHCAFMYNYKVLFFVHPFWFLVPFFETSLKNKNIKKQIKSTTSIVHFTGRIQYTAAATSPPSYFILQS